MRKREVRGAEGRDLGREGIARKGDQRKSGDASFRYKKGGRRKAGNPK